MWRQRHGQSVSNATFDPGFFEKLTGKIRLISYSRMRKTAKKLCWDRRQIPLPKHRTAGKEAKRWEIHTFFVLVTVFGIFPCRDGNPYINMGSKRMSICFALIILNSSNNFNLFFLIFKKTQKKIAINKHSSFLIASLCKKWFINSNFCLKQCGNV